MGGKKKELGASRRSLADLADHYGPEVFRLSSAERALLAAHLDRVKAQRTLDDVHAGRARLHHDTLYDVVLAATGNQDLAETYRNEALKARQAARQAASAAGAAGA